MQLIQSYLKYLNGKEHFHAFIMFIPHAFTYASLRKITNVNSPLVKTNEYQMNINI